MPHSPPNHPYPLKIMFIRVIILGGWRLIEKYFPWVKMGGGGWWWLSGVGAHFDNAYF